MRYVLGLDNGGTMTKAALFEETGREVAVASRETPLSTPHTGWNERDMEELWQANAACIREILMTSGVASEQIAGVGCTGHGKGLYLWGKNGAPAYAGIASTDRRAEDIVARWEADGTAAQVREQTLQPVIACQPVALLRWLKEQKPAVLENVQWILECKDYIRFRLTGRALAERTDYSGTSLMDLTTCQFDKGLLKRFGLEELYGCLPPLCNAWDCCGGITEEAAAQTGLRVGTPVSGGMFDIDACAVAMGVTDPEQLCMITGTWSINEYPAPIPVRADTTTHNSLFCLPDTYLIEESSPTSAGNLDWYLETCMKEEKKRAKAEGGSFYDVVDRVVETLPPEESDVLFLPFLYGTNTDSDHAAFVGLSNSYSAAHMLRAVFEGVVFSHRMHLERLLRFREAPRTIRLAGGAARSKVWVQLFADILQCPIEVVSTRELGAQGCAMTAAVAAGIYGTYTEAIRKMLPQTYLIQPDRSKAAVYDRKYARYVRLTTCLEGF